jgi:hypothetical protein
VELRLKTLVKLFELMLEYCWALFKHHILMFHKFNNIFLLNICGFWSFFYPKSISKIYIFIKFAYMQTIRNCIINWENLSLRKCVTKTKNCSESKKVDQILKVCSLLSPKIIIWLQNNSEKSIFTLPIFSKFQLWSQIWWWSS